MRSVNSNIFGGCNLLCAAVSQRILLGKYSGYNNPIIGIFLSHASFYSLFAAASPLHFYLIGKEAKLLSKLKRLLNTNKQYYYLNLRIPTCFLSNKTLEHLSADSGFKCL